ncbi:MAG: SbmA/BacA-like family transporter [Defluviicoccus sp.]
MVALLVIIVLLSLLVQYRLNIWNRDFFDALERKDGPELGQQALVFVPLVVASTTIAIFGVWSRMTAQRKWRDWLSQHLIALWLANGRYYRLHLAPGDHENPEYRIAEDARVATDAPIDFAVGLLQSVLIAITFINVLWVVGGDLVINASGRMIVVPGYLVIAAVVYAALATSAMLLIGRRLGPVVEAKNEAEAELRHAATRLQQRALRDGDWQENSVMESAVGTALGQVITQWRHLCAQLMRTTLISHANSLLSPLVGLILCAPKYLAGMMTLGEVTQATAAFFTVQAALNWLVDNYPRLADWRSSAHRVATLLVSLDAIDGLEDVAHSSRIPRGEYEKP